MASQPKLPDVLVPTYARPATVMARGCGTTLYDEKGKAYLDFTSGIAVHALGHSHPALLRIIASQGASLLHASNLFHTRPPHKLAQALVKHSFGDRVFFCNSGTEAIEAAIKFARKKTTAINPKQYHVLSFSDSFHGRTYGALSATAQRAFHRGFKPMLPGFHYAPFNDIAATHRVLAAREYAAIIVEPLQGEGGLNRAEYAFLSFLREYATRQGIALVFDEIQCGMGRTATLWHYEQHGIEPDLMTLAKPLGGGLPLGAVVCRNQWVETIAPGDHGTTFGGNPLACALGLEVLETVSRKAFLRAVQRKGARLATALGKLADSRNGVSAVVGCGLLAGVRMKSDPGPLIAVCRENGLLLAKAQHNTVRFIPPLTVEDDEIDRAVGIFAAELDRQ